MASSEKELSHNEIWDDSVLINSWDEALAEYKKYHSIHKNGGNVEHLLKPEQDSPDTEQGIKEAREGPDNDVVQVVPETEEKSGDKPEPINTSTQHSQPRIPGPPPGPGGLLGTIHDEGLKRLLMSWYYAGYYTGYYEGQHAPTQDQNSSK
ncbi:hypothetical protein GGS20DRAFT_584231 [Poronia punctata]|nr:hypothetical protein GGS20DRAFT_584231 [Poronia punctata]